MKNEGGIMQIIIKGSKGFKIYQETVDYIQKKFCRFEKMVREPAILEFTLAHTHNSRQTLDKTIIFNASLPDLTEPLHMEETTTHFFESSDILENRFKKFLLKYKEKYKKNNKRG